MPCCGLALFGFGAVARSAIEVIGGGPRRDQPVRAEGEVSIATASIGRSAPDRAEVCTVTATELFDDSEPSASLVSRLRHGSHPHVVWCVALS